MSLMSLMGFLMMNNFGVSPGDDGTPAVSLSINSSPAQTPADGGTFTPANPVQNDVVTYTVTATNSGTAPLVLQNVVADGSVVTAATAWSSLTLAPGASATCTITLSTSSAGAKSGSFSFGTNISGAQSTYSVIVTYTVWSAVYASFTQSISSTNLVANGNMETGDPPTGWSSLASGVLDGVADERTGGSGVQSLSVAHGGTINPGALKSFTPVAGDWLLMDCWLRDVDSGFCYVRMVTTTSSHYAPVSPYHQTTSWVQAETIGRSPGTSANVRAGAITSVSGHSSRFDDVRVRKITPNTQQVLPSANAGIELEIVLPFASTRIGQQINVLYRISTASNYWWAQLRRNTHNNNWSFELFSVAADVPTSRAVLEDIGTPEKLRIDCYGSQHQCGMYAGGIWTPLHAVVNVSHNDSSTGVNVIYSENMTPAYLRLCPSVPFDQGLSGTTLFWLDGDSKTDQTASYGFWPPMFEYLAERATGTDCQYYNVAVGGYTLDQGLTALAANLAAWPYGSPPDYALINFGANGAKVEATWKQALRNYIQTFHATFPGVPIYVMRPWVQAEDATFAALATWIETVCDEYTDVYVGPNENIFLKGSDNGAAEMFPPYPNAHANGWGSRLTALEWLEAIGL